MNKIKISPSILSADFSVLGDEVKRLEEAGADFVHIDVMDGHFVPNLTFGSKLVKDIRKCVKIPFDVHLMVSNPDQYIEDFANAGADIISIQYESVIHLDRTLSNIKKLGKKAGLVLNPSTPESVLEYVLYGLDLILVMTVNPGFGGQSFIEGQLKKIERIRSIIDKSSRSIDLEVDGGIKDTNAKAVIDAGANILVAGSYIFNSEDYKGAIDSLRG